MTSPSLDALHALYRAAEDAIKLYERIALDNLVAAVNELRYAGHHILAAERADEEGLRSESFMRAARHCERALYDAKEATIVALLEDMADFRDERFSTSEMDAVLPDWRDLFGKCAAAVRVLEQSGSVKRFEGTQADEAIAGMLDVRARLLACEMSINQLRQERAQRTEESRKATEESLAQERKSAEILRERRDNRRHIQNVVLAVLGVVLSALGLVAMLF